MEEILNNKLRFLLKRGKGGKPRELVLQELVEVVRFQYNEAEDMEESSTEFQWLDVPTVYEEDC